MGAARIPFRAVARPLQTHDRRGEIMRIMNEGTGKIIAIGSIVHLVAGPSVGQAWRVERVIPRADGHKIHCSRSHPRTGRMHREFPPHLFGCRVVVDVAWYRDRARLHRWASACVLQVVLLTIGGVIAWLIAEFGDAQLGGLLAALGAQQG
jgi:hypothetical protein